LLFWGTWRHHKYVVFNGAWLDIEAVKAKVRLEYDSWRLARGSNSFGFEEPVPWICGE
jgi:hypothetical protein